jgi:hypothetical protein
VMYVTASKALEVISILNEDVIVLLKKVVDSASIFMVLRQQLRLLYKILQ